MAPKCDPLCWFGERLYFTTFPHPAPAAHVLNEGSKDKEEAPRIRPTRARGAPSTPDQDATYYYFTVDNQLVYLSFYKDWGPLNLAMVYKACILIHELLEDEGLKSQRLVLYSSDDPRRKANTALLMALYIMIVQKKAPWEAFHPIAELEFMPFRDAGSGLSNFNLSIQDCLWGVWKAMQNGLCDMNEFNVDDYEYYEKVENGDWNWITPSFIAFASPVEPTWTKRLAGGDAGSDASPARGGSSTATNGSALQRKLPQPFVNCLEYFEQHDIRLVVRLNNMLYDRSHFLDCGIRHEELYFDDGSNPTDEIVRKFINLSDEVIEAGGSVAVHCKAGLGRTGTLIGAYLIWKYGFTAHEAIGFMRIVRPGSVVGPQQQYMYVKQLEWTKWAAVDEMRRAEAQAAAAIAASSIVTPATPPAEADEMDDPMESAPSQVLATAAVVLPSTPQRRRVPPVTPSKHVSAAAACAGATAPPGQPRKTPVAKRTADVAAVGEDDEDDEDDELNALPSLTTSNARSRSKSHTQATTARAGGKRVQPASEQRPTRVTRSTAAGGPGRRPGIVNGAGKGVGSGPSPNKIPRLANNPPSALSTRSTTSMGTRSRPAAVNGAAHPPSRLPTLVATAASPGKRGTAPAATGAVLTSVNANGTVTLTTDGPGHKKTPSDAWMKSNTAASVVGPAAKSGRPGLRSVRRRRSSFSAADVIA